MLTNVCPSPSSKNTKLANSYLKTECYFEFESLFSQLCMMLASSLIFGQKIFDTVRNFCLKLRLEISTSNLQMTFKGSCSGSGIIPTLDLGEGGSFYDIWNKMVKRLPSWQRSGVVSQQRLRLRLLTLVKRVSKLWFELIWFLFAILFFEGSLNALGRWKCLLLQRSEFWWKD